LIDLSFHVHLAPYMPLWRCSYQPISMAGTTRKQNPNTNTAANTKQDTQHMRQTQTNRHEKETWN